MNTEIYTICYMCTKLDSASSQKLFFFLTDGNMFFKPFWYSISGRNVLENVIISTWDVGWKIILEGQKDEFWLQQDRIMLVPLLPGVIYQKNVTSIVTAHPTLYKILHTLLRLSKTPV
jgi:hypothetical protein